MCFVGLCHYLVKQIYNIIRRYIFFRERGWQLLSSTATGNGMIYPMYVTVQAKLGMTEPSDSYLFISELRPPTSTRSGED